MASAAALTASTDPFEFGGGADPIDDPLATQLFDDGPDFSEAGGSGGSAAPVPVAAAVPVPVAAGPVPAPAALDKFVLPDLSALAASGHKAIADVVASGDEVPLRASAERVVGPSTQKPGVSVLMDGGAFMLNILPKTLSELLKPQSFAAEDGKLHRFPITLAMYKALLFALEVPHDTDVHFGTTHVAPSKTAESTPVGYICRSTLPDGVIVDCIVTRPNQLEKPTSVPMEPVSPVGGVVVYNPATDSFWAAVIGLARDKDDAQRIAAAKAEQSEKAAADGTKDGAKKKARASNLTKDVRRSLDMVSGYGKGQVLEGTCTVLDDGLPEAGFLLGPAGSLVVNSVAHVLVSIVYDNMLEGVTCAPVVTDPERELARVYSAALQRVYAELIAYKLAVTRANAEKTKASKAAAAAAKDAPPAPGAKTGTKASAKAKSAKTAGSKKKKAAVDDTDGGGGDDDEDDDDDGAAAGAMADDSQEEGEDVSGAASKTNKTKGSALKDKSPSLKKRLRVGAHEDDDDSGHGHGAQVFDLAGVFMEMKDSSLAMLWSFVQSANLPDARQARTKEAVASMCQEELTNAVRLLQQCRLAGVNAQGIAKMTAYTQLQARQLEELKRELQKLQTIVHANAFRSGKAAGAEAVSAAAKGKPSKAMGTVPYLRDIQQIAMCVEDASSGDEGEGEDEDENEDDEEDDDADGAADASESDAETAPPAAAASKHKASGQVPRPVQAPLPAPGSQKRVMQPPMQALVQPRLHPKTGGGGGGGSGSGSGAAASASAPPPAPKAKSAAGGVSAPIAPAPSAPAPKAPAMRMPTTHVGGGGGGGSGTGSRTRNPLLGSRNYA